MLDSKDHPDWFRPIRLLGWLLLLGVGATEAAIPVTSVILPPEAIFVSEKVVSSAQQSGFRVSSGGNLTVDGSGNTVFVEAGGQLSVSGGGNFIYLEPKAVCSITGKDNLVHITPGALVKMGPGNSRRFAVGYEVVLSAKIVASSIPEPMVPVQEASPPGKTVLPAVNPAQSKVGNGSTVNAETNGSPVGGGESMRASVLPGVAGSDPPGVVVARAPDSASAPPAVVVQQPTVTSRAREKFAALEADPLIATMPIISDLLALLPVPEDPIPGDKNEIGGVGGDATLHGVWMISSLELANAPGGLAPVTKGAVDFWADGTGTMRVAIDVIGQKIERRGWFRWSATENTLEINPGSGRHSSWKRQSLGKDEQEAVMIIDGNEVKLKLKRGTESAP